MAESSISKNCIKGREASSFPIGTKIATATEKGGGNIKKSEWTFNGKDFVDKNGKKVSPQSLLPQGIKLDLNGDGKYDAKDLSIFNKEKNLSTCLDNGLTGDYYIQHPGAEGGWDDASINKGNLTFTATNANGGEDGTNKEISYKIILPKDKK